MMVLLFISMVELIPYELYLNYNIGFYDKKRLEESPYEVHPFPLSITISKMQYEKGKWGIGAEVLKIGGTDLPWIGFMNVLLQTKFQFLKLELEYSLLYGVFLWIVYREPGYAKLSLIAAYKEGMTKSIFYKFLLKFTYILSYYDEDYRIWAHWISLGVGLNFGLEVK